MRRRLLLSSSELSHHRGHMRLERDRKTLGGGSSPACYIFSETFEGWSATVGGRLTTKNVLDFYIWMHF